MVFVTARKKVKGLQFEISVDFDQAMKFRQGKGDIMSALNSTAIFTDLNKGMKASKNELENAFGSYDFHSVAEIIIKEGEIQKPQEFRDAEREARVKKVVDLILRNAVDQHGRPYTEERIKKAIEEVHFNFDNRPAEQQMMELVEKIKPIIPISIQMKKIKLKIPARFTGQIYGLLKDYKQNEEWLSNGDLQAILLIPAGMQLDFYEKLNDVTHGSVQSEEIKE